MKFSNFWTRRLLDGGVKGKWYLEKFWVFQFQNKPKEP